MLTVTLLKLKKWIITIGQGESRRFCANHDQTNRMDGSSPLPYISSYDLLPPLHHTATRIYSNNIISIFNTYFNTLFTVFF